MKSKAIITRKFLDGLPKSKLVSVVREMESYLVNTANNHNEMYWKGRSPADHKQMCVTREIAAKDATVHLRTLVGGGI